MRYDYPIGPTPNGWHKLDKITCERNIPHTECSDQFENDEMNYSHYLPIDSTCTN